MYSLNKEIDPKQGLDPELQLKMLYLHILKAAGNNLKIGKLSLNKNET